MLIALVPTRSGEFRDRLVATLQEQATVVPLTGLVNRRAFDEALPEARASQTRPRGAALALVDIAPARSIDDRYGYPSATTPSCAPRSRAATGAGAPCRPASAR